MKTQKLAIIGGSCNSAVGYNHLIACQLDHRFEIVSACFSSNLQTSEDTVHAWNLKDIRLYASWNELLQAEKSLIDAVLILTPTPLHYEMVMESLRLGIPTICEKAITSTYEQARQITDVQEDVKGFLAVTHNYTGYPMVRQLKALCDLSVFGRILQVRIEMPQEGFIKLDMADNKPIPQPWRLLDGEIPSISLDLGTHLQHMIHYLTGENPISLLADQNTFGHFSQVIDDVTILAKYPSGMRSSMWLSKASLGHRNGLRVRLYGEKGAAEWYQMNPEELTVYDVHGNAQITDRASYRDVSSELRYNRFKPGHPAGFIEAFGNIYVDIADKLLEFQQTQMNDVNWTYGSRQAAIGLKVLHLSSTSSEIGKWVNLDTDLAKLLAPQ